MKFFNRSCGIVTAKHAGFYTGMALIAGGISLLTQYLLITQASDNNSPTQAENFTSPVTSPVVSPASSAAEPTVYEQLLNQWVLTAAGAGSGVVLGAVAEVAAKCGFYNCAPQREGYEDITSSRNYTKV